MGGGAAAPTVMPQEKLGPDVDPAAIRDFLMPLEIISLRVTRTAELFRVAYFLPPLPLLLLCMALPLAGMLLFFWYDGPLFDSWRLSGIFFGVALAAAAGGVIAFQHFTAPLRPRQVRLVYDRQRAVLELPAEGVTIPREAILRFVTLYGLLREADASAWTCELSVIYRRDGAVWRAAILLAPRFRARQIAEALAELTRTGHLELEQARDA